MHNVTGDDLIMQEEIFGPLLPIIKMKTVQEAIEFINERYVLFLQSLLFLSSALFFKIDVLKHFAIFTEKHPCRSLFKKVADQKASLT